MVFSDPKKILLTSPPPSSAAGRQTVMAWFYLTISLGKSGIRREEIWYFRLHNFSKGTSGSSCGSEKIGGSGPPATTLRIPVFEYVI